MTSSAHSPETTQAGLPVGCLRRVHHIALNVRDLERSRQFYGELLGLYELLGAEVPSTLKDLVQQGKVANFITPDGTVIDLFSTPDLAPPHPDPQQEFTRANHLAFDIDPRLFEQALATFYTRQIPIAMGPVERPTGRGVYLYDPDGFIVEVRCDPLGRGESLDS